ncbi:hypothetical protein SAMN05443549_101976 [Flavobacterium fluvii]|uniref:Long-chain fatty acid transport protein n=1 Tax=Flavobacterium fluvii TaxID=468056 RepID=A0A1M5FWB6_9FLAO|nr:hypothetical protein [Flavobacterium fluvii]SHF95739.1 hypothetical protein SAMN05443549_101976 [Flavobacterium fluvii]
MIKKIIISACLFMTLVSFSQEGTSSPYSFYGIGDIKFSGTLENRSMGGISIAQDSTHINLQNPASYANLKWTAFTIGGASNYTKQKSGSESATAQKTTLDYLALGIPLGQKFGGAFGLIPYSSVGYRIANENPDPTQISKRFNGWGGLNRVFMGFGYNVVKNLNVGVNAYYNFGKIQSKSLEYIPEVSTGSSEMNVVTLSGVNFNIGMMYKAKLTDKLSVFSSLYYSPGSTLKAENTRTIATVSYNSVYDLQLVDVLPEQTSKADLKLPKKLAIGAGIGDSKKWLLGGEIAVQGSGNLANNYNTIDDVSYENSERYSIGGYYTPNSNPFSSYLERITYRGGFKYEKTGLIVNSTSINDVSLNFGMGLPITGSLSNFNVGLEYGQKGTTSHNLVQENYFSLMVSFSLNDKWFVKRKFF